MAWSSTALSSEDQALLAADKPLILWENILEQANEIKWVSSQNHGATDRTNSLYPTRALHDGFSHIVTTTSLTGTDFWISIEFTADVAFDALWIKHHNFDGGTLTVERSNASFYSSPTVVASGAVSGTLPVVNLNFAGSSQQLSSTGTSYLSIGISKAAAFLPYVGEIMLGRRVQLRKNSMVGPFHDLHEVSSVAETQSESGVISRYVKNRGRRMLSLELSEHEDAWLTKLKGTREASQSMTRPMVYWENPSSDARDAVFYMPDPVFPLRRRGFTERSLAITAIEQGPHFVALEDAS